MIIPSMARTRRYMHGQRRRQCPFSPMKSHHFGTPHIEDKEGNIIGVGNRQGIRIEGRGVVFDRSSQEQAEEADERCEQCAGHSIGYRGAYENIEESNCRNRESV